LTKIHKQLRETDKHKDAFLEADTISYGIGKSVL